MQFFREPGSSFIGDPRDLRIRDLQECGDKAVVGVPWDWSTGGDPGARRAPGLILREILSLPTYSPSVGYHVKCKPRLPGNIAVSPSEWEKTRAIIIEASSRLFQENRFTLFIGGDHSITGPILEALIERGTIGLLMLDAHYDLRSIEWGVSSGRWLWDVASRHLGSVSAAIIGVGEYSNPHYLAERASRLGFHVVPSLSVWEDIGSALEAVDWLASQSPDIYYITIDMDHLAEAYAPGVNSPSPTGLAPYHTFRILSYALKKLSPLLGADMVEVVPVKDLRGATVRLAARIGAHLLAGTG
ncbi:MAG: arginase family protein [Desulfurococcales archaeon]|nr:arginase family protein [Desulfurococcales archaeon]